MSALRHRQPFAVQMLWLCGLSCCPLERTIRVDSVLIATGPGRSSTHIGWVYRPSDPVRYELNSLSHLGPPPALGRTLWEDRARFARQAPSSSLTSSGWRSRIVIN